MSMPYEFEVGDKVLVRLEKDNLVYNEWNGKTGTVSAIYPIDVDEAGIEVEYCGKIEMFFSHHLHII